MGRISHVFICMTFSVLSFMFYSGLKHKPLLTVVNYMKVDAEHFVVSFLSARVSYCPYIQVFLMLLSLVCTA